MRVTAIFCFLLLTIFLFANSHLGRSEYFREKLRRNLNSSLENSFKQNNKKLFFDEYELLQYNLKKVPFIQDSFFLYDVIEYFPWEFYETYISNRILIYSFNGYVDFSLQLKKYDSQLLQISIPLDKLNFLKPTRKED